MGVNKYIMDVEDCLNAVLLTWQVSSARNRSWIHILVDFRDHAIAQRLSLTYYRCMVSSP